LEQQNKIFNIRDSRFYDVEKGITPTKTVLSGYINFHDNYVYGSARDGEEGYPWNLLTYRSYDEVDAQSSSLKISIRDSFLWVPLEATLANACYCFFDI
jgi:hypothetical protein